MLFAISPVIAQRAMRRAGPLAGATISVPTTSLLFLALAPLTIDPAGWNQDGAIVFLVAGTVFPVAVTLLTFASSRHLGATLTGALGNLAPLFAVGLAVALFGERPSGAQWAGIGAIVAGVVAMFLGGATVQGSAPRLAFLLPIAAALVRGVTQPLVKFGLQSWPNPFAAVTIGYLVSAIVILSLRAMSREPAPGGWSHVPWFMAVGLCNGSAVLALYAALSLGPVSVVAPLVAMYPVITLALDRLLRRGQRLGRSVVAGVGISVGGVVLLLVG